MRPRHAFLLFLMLLALTIATRSNLVRKDIAAFRAAPPLAKAQRLIERGNTSEALVALKRTLSYDANNGLAQVLLWQLTHPLERRRETSSFLKKKFPLKIQTLLKFIPVRMNQTQHASQFQEAGLMSLPVSITADKAATSCGTSDLPVASTDPVKPPPIDAAYNLASSAYQALASHNRREAAQRFTQALSFTSATDSRAAGWKRDLALLQDRWRVTAYSFLRVTPSSSAPGLGAPPGLGGSQAAAQVQFHLTPLARNPLDLSTRLITDLNTPDNIQSTIGLGWQPLGRYGPRVVMERWVKTGPQSRNAWALRLAAGTGKGYTPEPGQAGWWHWSTYGEAALIGFNRRNLYAAGAFQGGRGYRLTNHLDMIATANVWGIAQQDEHFSSRLEAGPGLWLRYRIGDQPVDLKIEYRQALINQTTNPASLTLTLGLGF